LVPGVGAQGGDVNLAVRSGMTKSGGGLVINSSRGILDAGSGPSDSSDAFAAAARHATLELRAAIDAARR
jgi:orotidine-5'-phosphate decarboxylase